MAELRWILLFVGALIIGGVYLWSKRQLADGNSSADTSSERTEPSLSPNMESVEEPVWPAVTAEVETEKRDPRPRGQSPKNKKTKAKANRYKDLSGEEKIVSLRVAGKGGLLLNGMDVVKALMDVGLMHGSFQIFHRMAENSETPIFSVASLLEPGTFDLSKLESMNTPGLTFFMVLPGEADGIEVFNDMLATAREVAERMNCELLDEKGSALTAQGAGFIRDEIIQFQHHAD